MFKEYDTRRLRMDLMDYYGTATNFGLPGAAMDLAAVEHMSDAELVGFAQQTGVELDDYVARKHE